MPAPVLLGVLLLVFPDCLLGYKVFSNEAKTASFCQQQPTRSSPVECADVLQEVTCDTAWSSACPGLENPLGSEFNDAKISVLCEDLCTQKVALSELDNDDPRLATAKSHMECFDDMIEKAEEAEDHAAAKRLRKLMAGEVAVDVKKIAILSPDDEESIEGNLLAAQEVAVTEVKEQFASETEEVLSAMEISDETVKEYTATLEAVANSCGDGEEAKSIAEDSTDLLHHMQDGHKTESELAQIQHEEIYLDKRCSVEKVNVDYFIKTMKVKYGSAKCGSSLLQTAHQQLADDLSHKVDQQAKQVLALHTKENQLGHRFVRHLKLALGGDHSHPELADFYEDFAEIARGNLTQGQRARLQHLDQHPHWQQKRTSVRCGVDERTKSAEILKDYKQCICDAVESVMVCQLHHLQALKDNSQHMSQKLSRGVALARQKEEKKQTAVVARDHQNNELVTQADSDLAFNMSVNGTHHLAKGAWFAPCTSGFVSGTFCVGDNCFTYPLPAYDSKNGWVKEAQSGTGVFLWFRNLVNNHGRKPVPCISATATFCLGLQPGDPLKLKFNLGAAIQNCGGVIAIMSTFNIGISLNLCMGIPGLSHLLALLDQDCWTLASTKYYPFIGKLVVGDTSIWGEYWITGESKTTINFNFAVHELTKPVTEYCNLQGGRWWDRWSYYWYLTRYGHATACSKLPNAAQCKVHAAETSCLAEFNEYRGTDGQSLKVKVEDMYHEAYDCWWEWCSYRYKWKTIGEWEWQL